ncbi:MAG: protein translocase subunit SecF [bacterium]|nr:protein translocase subunit SecF [bacterium]
MIKYIQNRKYNYIFSGLLITLSIYFLLVYRLNVAIDFTGGTNWNIQTDLKTEEIKEIISNNKIEVYKIDVKDGIYNLSLNTITSEQKNKILDELKGKDKNLVENKFETIGPSLGRELLIKTLIAIALSSIAIMLYVSYQFNEAVFGVSAIIAMIHDVIILIGSFSFLGHFYGVQVDSLFVTAVLTILSFSVHDTIVVFDRYREVRKNQPKMALEEQMNLAINSTMVRSLNNSVATAIMLLAVFLLGGETIKWFVLALFIGIIVGTYSSPFVSTPLVYEWLKRRK